MHAIPAREPDRIPLRIKGDAELDQTQGRDGVFSRHAENLIASVNVGRTGVPALKMRVHVADFVPGWPSVKSAFQLG